MGKYSDCAKVGLRVGKQADIEVRSKNRGLFLLIPRRCLALAGPTTAGFVLIKAVITTTLKPSCPLPNSGRIEARHSVKESTQVTTQTIKKHSYYKLTSAKTSVSKISRNLKDVLPMFSTQWPMVAGVQPSVKEANITPIPISATWRTYRYHRPDNRRSWH